MYIKNSNESCLQIKWPIIMHINSNIEEYTYIYVEFRKIRDSMLLLFIIVWFRG